MKRLTIGSLFDGSGGFPLGAAFYGITPVWASEIEPFAIRVTTKRLPQMKHLGDIARIDGGAIPPVDIISFGSPCTDLSVAGRRAGLSGSQSSLFYEAIRVIKEMREATNGKYPRFLIFENVQGAFNSNKGADFKAILDTIIQIVEAEAEVPPADKDGWPYADILVGNGWSLAYRLIDAQFFGVAQRRKRVYLVADFGSECAGEILFERTGVSRDFTPGGSPWEGAAGNTPDDAGTAIQILNDQGGSYMSISENVTATLRAEEHGHQPIVAVHQNQAGELRTGDVANTLSTNGNASGRNAPIVAAFTLDQFPCAVVYGISPFDSEGMKSANPHAGIYEASTSKTLDANGGNPACNQGGMAVVAYDCRNHAATPISATLQAKNSGGQSLNYINPIFADGYIVRRLTPQECALLQGFVRDWCAGLETPEPNEADISFWSEVWETYRRIIGKSKKPKTRNQIVKWLRQPHSDSAEYKLWGNGVALPCVCFVMAGICEVAEN